MSSVRHRRRWRRLHRSATFGFAVALLFAACGTPGFFVPVAAQPGADGPGTSARPAASFDPGSLDVLSPPTTAWEVAMAEIERDGTVPLSVALKAFSVTVGPLPGVELPDAPPGEVETGTGPVMWVLSHWDELTPEQQAEVERLLDPELDPQPSARGQGPLLASIGGRLLPGALPRPPQAAVDEYRAAAEAAKVKIEARLSGRTLQRPIELIVRNLQGNEGRVYATTIPVDRDGALQKTGAMTTCQIQLTSLGQNISGFELESVVAHEVFHCFQFELGPIEQVSLVAPWLAEGSAAWVGEDVSGGSTIGGEFYVGWLRTPFRPLFTRTYAGMGFFAHLKDSGLDPWDLLDRMNSAGSRSSADAYEIAAKAPSGDAMIDAWGPSYFRDVSLGADWSLGFPGVQDPSSTPKRMITAEDGTNERFQVDPIAAASPTEIDLKTDILVIKAKTARGLIRFSDGKVLRLADVIGTPLCAKSGGCACPAGSKGAGHVYAAIPRGLIMLGVTSHTEQVSLEVLGYDVAAACDKTPTDFKEPPDCYCPPGPLDNLLPPKP